ncbi:VCBS repeat-containing protein [Ferruginibacter sp.]|uniref:FG-GAP repeat domain-containing protein n=1 Tax=Ferruginibacter sp. TaxID=1940288 RepID=UPI00265B18ED|nr:VCBS repeat-containing protein [Ferruginibacter sp.]
MISKDYAGYLIRFLFVGTIALLYSCNSCNDFKKNQTHQNISDKNIARGKILAATYCQNCHQLPDPSLLDSKHWEEGVLPAMGPRLGIFYFTGFKEYPSSRRDRNVDQNYYPSTPLLSFDDWQCILDYYTALSPDTLPAQQRQYAVKKNDELFKIETPETGVNSAATCLVKIDTLKTPHQLLVADASSRNLYRFNKQLSILDSVNIKSPIVDIEIRPDEMLACGIGIMNPNNGKFGTASFIHTGTTGRMVADTIHLFNSLARPVQLCTSDFNGDGKPDYLVCEFGHLAGALSWMENTGNGKKFTRHILRNIPGAIKAYVQDVNKDGLPDIWALFSQGDEGIFLFTNKGHGKFEQEQVLRFPPINGSSYFELADFNKDGFPDILYTCGDNADLSSVLKPYHGVYIYMNDGSNHFKQQYFFSMHGCYKAMARDFDGDGDLDIAAISFFADYANHPEESFIYLENKGNLDLHPYSIAGTSSGRWLTMDAADIDGDGKVDIVLGNFSIAPAFIQGAANWKQGPPFMVLKNIIKK